MTTKKKPELRNPMQPLYKDGNKTIRFKENVIVRTLLDWATNKGMGLNELAMMEFSQDDREQFAQLIGYSLGGFGELSYVRNDTYNAASMMAEAGEDEKSARIAALEHALHQVRKGLKQASAAAFRIHPDDLNE